MRGIVYRLGAKEAGTPEDWLRPAVRVAAGEGAEQKGQRPGVGGQEDHRPPTIVLPSYEAVSTDRYAFAEMTKIAHHETNPYNARLLVQFYDRECIVVNPPRKGLQPAALESIAGVQARRIVYVSCEPITLARDLDQLTGHGYHVRHLKPFDMFPQTEQVETIALLSQR